MSKIQSDQAIPDSSSSSEGSQSGTTPQKRQHQASSQVDYSLRITVLTLLAYLLGLFAYFSPYMPGFIITILAAALTLNPKYQLFIQPPAVLLSFIATTFAFGLIHAFTYHQLTVFLDAQPQPSQTISQNPSQSAHQQWPLLQIYMSFLCVYYYFEFQLNNCFHHYELNWKSFLIYHSTPYFIAQTFCICEHLLVKYLLGFQYKNSHLLIYPSLLLMTLGEGLRISAFFTAKSNFTHLVRYKRHPQHQLITHGVYSFFRHPSYTGYFYFAVSSQLFLANWLSSVLFSIVLVKFFNDRIYDEEFALAKFFPNYLKYKQTTHILIPFVKSPSIQQIQKSLFEINRVTTSIDKRYFNMS